MSTKSIDKYFLQNVGHGTVDIARMLLELIFTAQCTLVHLRGLGIVCRPSVCPSVCDVGDL